MQLRSVVCAAMLVTPGLAAAQMPLPSMQPAPPLSGLYIGAGVGVNWLQNEHLINTQGTSVSAREPTTCQQSPLQANPSCPAV
jgi:hypothetical protein